MRMSDVSITDLIARLRYQHEPSNPLAAAHLETIMDAAADALENSNTTIALDLGYMRVLEAKIAALESVTVPYEDVVIRPTIGGNDRNCGQSENERESISVKAERILDDETHADLCGCLGYPGECSTYGEMRPWSHSDPERWTGAVLLAAGFRLPVPAVPAEDELEVPK